VLRLEGAREAAMGAASAVPALNPPDWDDDGALGDLLRAADATRRARRLRAARAALDEAGAPLGRGPGHPVQDALLGALGERDVGYEAALQELERLQAGVAALRRRQDLLRRLDAGEAQLAGLLTSAPLDPAWDRRLAELSEAWRWSQADAWLEAQADPRLVSRLERDLDDARQRIERATRRLAAELAWARCLGRLSESERVHLETWEEAVRKIGRGTGSTRPAGGTGPGRRCRAAGAPSRPGSCPSSRSPRRWTWPRRPSTSPSWTRPASPARRPSSSSTWPAR
jgi:hypothetical protein